MGSIFAIKQNRFLKREIFQLPSFAIQPHHGHFPHQRLLTDIADSAFCLDGLSYSGDLMFQLQPIQPVLGFFDLFKDLGLRRYLIAAYEQPEEDN